MSDSLPDNAGVRVIPPLVYVAGLVIGYVVWWFWPAPIVPGGAGIACAIGVLLILAGIGVTVWAVLTFRRIGTSPIPVAPTTALAFGGPYEYTRNPMYLGLAATHAGIAFLGNALWPLVALIPVVWVIQTQVIDREEAYLMRKFGEEYRAYMGRVRRWF